MKKISLIFFLLIINWSLALGSNYFPEASSSFHLINDYTLSQDVEWAAPNGVVLTMDIYTPERGEENYPVLMIFHGGGWLVNDKSIMDDMSQYVVTNADYVVCNVNYRLLSDQDNTVTMDEIVEDAFGALLWVRENIGNYKGDADRIAVSGDSAGGHLAAMIVNAGHQLQEDGLLEGEKGFNPTYIPEGKSLEEIKNGEWMKVQAAVLNYPALDIHLLAERGYERGNRFWQSAGVEGRGIFSHEYNVSDHPEYYKAVSPMHTVPDASERKLPPHLLTIGTEDELIPPVQVQEYARKLEEAGHHVEYWEHEGRPHAFLDSGVNERLGIKFEQDAPEAIDRIIKFLNGVFNNGG